MSKDYGRTIKEFSKTMTKKEFGSVVDAVDQNSLHEEIFQKYFSKIHNLEDIRQAYSTLLRLYAQNKIQTTFFNQMVRGLESFTKYFKQEAVEIRMKTLKEENDFLVVELNELKKLIGIKN